MVDVATAMNNRRYNTTDHHVCFEEGVGYAALAMLLGVHTPLHP